MFLNKLLHPLRTRKYLINRSNAWRVSDTITIAIMAMALLALLGLVYFYLRPIPTVDIKVPVPTVKAEYAHGEIVEGIFFGEVYYNGNVNVHRKLVCDNYIEVLPDRDDDIDDLVQTVSVPRKLEGQTSPIGALPSGAPVGKQCIVEFTNTYTIQTPFGVRNIEVTYYTQGFKVISKGTAASNQADTDQSNANDLEAAQQPSQPTVNNNSSTTTNNNTENNSTTTTTNPPPTTPKCTVDVLGVKLFCN